MDLKYLIRHSENKENSPSIFLLHVYGSNKEDLFSLEGYLPKNHTIISLETPISLPFDRFTWFEVKQEYIINKSCEMENSYIPQWFRTKRKRASPRWFGGRGKHNGSGTFARIVEKTNANE